MGSGDCMVKIDIKNFSKMIEKGSKCAVVEYGNTKQKISFSTVKVGYGEKLFLSCPICGKNKYTLYYENNLFRCSECCSLNTYKGIQNTTKGGEAYLEYKMERFAMRCGIGQFEYPFDFRKHPRPKGKHRKKWNTNLAIMQCLENMRSQSIFFQRIWNSKTIQSVERKKNKYLLYPLPLLERYFYDFDNGITLI